MSSGNSTNPPAIASSSTAQPNPSIKRRMTPLQNTDIKRRGSSSSQKITSFFPQTDGIPEDYWLAGKGNKFAPLADNKMETETETANTPPPSPKVLKPPPVFIHGVQDFKTLKNTLQAKITNNLVLKNVQEGQIRVQMETPEDYKKLIVLLDEKKTLYHSYQGKDNRKFRVVVKGLHHSTEDGEIISSLKDHGHTVHSVGKIFSRQKIQLPMFYVNLELDPKNKNIFNINRLLCQVVTVEPPRARKVVPQCANCQRFGHTKKYCKLSPRCVKCTQMHATADCERKTRDDHVKCVLCEGNHPANWKGCIKYKEAYSKMFPSLSPRIIGPINRPTPPTRDPTIKAGKSFADALNENLTATERTQTSKSEIEEIRSVIKDLSQQMQTMMNLLTTIVTKMFN